MHRAKDLVGQFAIGGMGPTCPQGMGQVGHATATSNDWWFALLRHHPVVFFTTVLLHLGHYHGETGIHD